MLEAWDKEYMTIALIVIFLTETKTKNTGCHFEQIAAALHHTRILIA